MSISPGRSEHGQIVTMQTVARLKVLLQAAFWVALVLGALALLSMAACLGAA